MCGRFTVTAKDTKTIADRFQVELEKALERGGDGEAPPPSKERAEKMAQGLDRYNVALAQAVLLRSTRVRVAFRGEPPQRYRQLLRAVKFHRLICEVEKTGPDAGQCSHPRPSCACELGLASGRRQRRNRDLRRSARMRPPVWQVGQ